MTIGQLKRDIRELKNAAAAAKKPNSWPHIRSKEEIDELMQKYRDMGLWDNKDER